MERLKRIKINARLDWVDDTDGVIERVDWLQEGDFRWLIKQAEKAEQYEKTLKEIAAGYEHCESMLEYGFIDYYDGYEKTDKAKEVLEEFMVKLGGSELL